MLPWPPGSRPTEAAEAWVFPACPGGRQSAVSSHAGPECELVENRNDLEASDLSISYAISCVPPELGSGKAAKKRPRILLVRFHHALYFFGTVQRRVGCCDMQNNNLAELCCSLCCGGGSVIAAAAGGGGAGVGVGVSGGDCGGC